MNASDKQVLASGIHQSMVGNPLFPAPSPSMAEFGQAIADLKKANLDAEDRGRTAILHRDLADEKISDMITRLAGYVNSICLGDPQQILSAGFKLIKRSEPLSAIGAPRTAQARPSALPNQLDLRWATVPGAIMYMVEEATGGTFDTPEWTMIKLTSDHRMVLEGRDKSQPCSFRVHAMGRRNTKGPFKVFFYQLAA